MRLGRTALWMLLAKNACELRFRRRIEKPGFGDYRRMLCTSDMGLLQSAAGRQIFHFQSPIHHLKYSPASKNLIVTYDLFMQNWRMVNCNDVEAIAIISTYPDPTKFWEYFNLRLNGMSATHKAQFMNT